MTVATAPGACPLCGPDYSYTELARGPDFEYRTTGSQEFRFTRCDSCGIVVLNPRPADGEIASLYPPEYEPYRFDRLPSIIRKGRDAVQRRKVDLIARHAPAGGTVVDVGCGNGSLLRLIRAYTRDRFTLVGWDYPGPHLEQLKAAGFRVIAAPIERAHVPQDVDLFILNQVIEHVPHPDELLAILGSALSPGGRVILETPDTSALDARLFSQRYWGGYHIPRHMTLFDQRNLPQLVERCGLRVVEIAHLASPAFWVQSLHHLTSESRMPWLAPLCTLRNIPLTMLFAAFDTVRATMATTSNQRLVAEKPA